MQLQVELPQVKNGYVVIIELLINIVRTHELLKFVQKYYVTHYVILHITSNS